ncbi:hypothetical protein KAW50_02625 [candidate division WOR-3 bacterium]|nr:hypothetical protein [candidate division WOR-3 bacterium]
MPKRSLNYRKLLALEDERKLEELSAFEDAELAMYDPSGLIPATGPEKIVYNALLKLRVRFQFQYHLVDFPETALNESIYIPDFTLPDYDIVIEVYGTYWHSQLGRRSSDEYKMALALYKGQEVIEHGIVARRPDGGATRGRYIIWWDYEIYQNIDHLFTRDVPELFSANRISGRPDQYLLDRKEEEKQLRSQRARLIKQKLVPRVHPYTRKLRRLRRKQWDLTKTYPFLKGLYGRY